MNYLQRIEFWGDHHHPKWLDILRIGFGIFLFYKGIQFAGNLGTIMTVIDQRFPFSDFQLIIVSHYILFAHIFGGVLLVFGLLTRLACIIQIPAVLGAIFFVNASPEVFRQFSELLVSILVLLLLIYFLVIGSGPWSLDRFIEEERKYKR